MTSFIRRLMPTHSFGKKKTIIFVIDGLGVGGAERLMTPILRHLDRERFSVRVCVLQSKDGNPLAEDIRALGVPVDFLNVRRLRDFTAILRLRNYLKKSRADIVHTQLEFANILGNISAKLLGLPSVCTVHVLPALETSLKSRLHQSAEWMMLRIFCDRVIAVSEEARLHYIAHSGIPPRKLVMIHNGIDLTQFQRLEPDIARAAVRREFNLPDNSILLTTVAVLRPLKGIEYMIRALPAICAAYPTTCYLIAGDGAYRDILMREAEQADVKERVIFAGRRADIPRILSASDIFVLPTLTEALPTVLAEAMACRLPIVASAVGGVPEMIRSGENGILIPPMQPAELSRACNALLADSDLRVRMGEEGWKLVNQKFNIDRQVLQLEQQYFELINCYEK